MRSTALRHVIRLRLTLVGPVPEIWREVVVDRELALADIRSVIQSVFDGQVCRHHLFTDSLESPAWSRTRRRWGDRWTMIDLRDPTVIEEKTARIGSVMRDSQPLYYGHTCEGGWLVEIEAHEDDVCAASSPPARVTAGERRAPLDCCRSPYEHAVLVGVLDDVDHPEHDVLKAAIARTVGPWSHFDAEHFDLDDAQRRIDALGLGHAEVRGEVRRGDAAPLHRLVERLPRAARAGLEAHIAASAIDLPIVMTVDEARVATRPFAWIISRAAGGGIPIVDGGVDPAVLTAGVEELGLDEARVRQLITLAKRARLLYSRSGRLVANKRSAAAAQHPTELWSLLARELVQFVAPHHSGDLFLLAVADGSLAEPEIGLRRTAQALALVNRGVRYGTWTGYRPYESYAGYPDGFGSGRGSQCEQECDCPTDGPGSWHDAVTRAIRRAASEGASDGARSVASEFSEYEAHDLGFISDWFKEPAPARAALATRTESEFEIDDRALLQELRELIDLLTLFGLERADDGSWIVPPTLREFAREGLMRTHHRTGGVDW